MLRPGRSARGIRSVLLVVFLCCVVAAQMESFAHAHPHAHSSTQHCCALCHAGPLPFLQPVIAAAVLPHMAVVWITPAAEIASPRQSLVSGESPRAPPSLSLVFAV